MIVNTFPGCQRSGDLAAASRDSASVVSQDQSGYQLGLPGEAALKLRGATEHPDYALALAITAIDAASRGDLDIAEQRCTRALEAARRLHTRTNLDVKNLVCQARADSALMRAPDDQENLGAQRLTRAPLSCAEQ